MGKLIAESREEADLSARILRYYGDEGPGIAAPQPLVTDGADAALLTEPMGVLLAVEPWNYPLYQVVRVAGPNLVLGNALLLKHAGNCPQCALAIERLFRDAGVPTGVYTNMFMATDDVPHVIASPVVRGVSLTVDDGEVVSLVGRNGAGRTTIIESITGLLPVRSGRITFRGEDITRLPPHRRAKRGIGYAPENSGIFPELTVAENLKMGAWTFRRDAKRVARQLDQVYALFPVLKERRATRAGALSGGQGRMLSVARELMTAPRRTSSAR